MGRALALAAALLVLSGCSVSGITSRPGFDDVMKDPQATADEIITAAGPPDEVARSADGSLLVLWKPFIQEDSVEEFEGATAWRLFDPRGRTVQTYSSPDLQDLWLTATGDGFLIVDNGKSMMFERAVFVDGAGTQHPVKDDRRQLATRPGDSFVATDVARRFYRPSDRSLHRLLPEPGTARHFVQWDGALIDEQGALWQQGYEGKDHWVGWSRDGGRTLTRQTLPLLQPGGTLDQPAMAVAHGVTAVLSDQVKGDAGGSVGPAYLDVVSGYGRSTHRITAASLPFLKNVVDGGEYAVSWDLSVTTDGRVLLGDPDAGEWWVAKDPSNTAFERLPLPRHTAYVRDLGGTLYAWGDFDDRDATLQSSTDDGGTWSTYDVTP